MVHRYYSFSQYSAHSCSSAILKIENSNLVSNAGVEALCVRTTVEGAFLNVKINAAGYEDKQ
ncbi:MAG TPA: cyclodeaminase/cyclohydrolase family protein [Draconibacterium sp.]|nr:cyclodeaminase/cyclohydrolase family protein [Draconibacterium sp.]